MDYYNKALVKKFSETPAVTSECVCCGSVNVGIGVVDICAFVVERMLNTIALDDISALGVGCNDCGFICTAVRFTDEQMRGYYSEYMQDDKTSDGRVNGSYVFHRRRAEGDDWYQLLKLYKQDWWVEARAHAIARSLIAEKIDLNKIESVLDFGGDLGQYIPKEFNHARRHVVEIEERTLVDGVTAVKSPNECDPVDLVICCHTLEHVSYPMELVLNMKKYLKPGGLIYIEIPNEDKIVNNSSETVPLRIHEHINIFFPNSLRALLHATGFQPLNVYEIPYGNVHKDLDPARAIIGRLL